jgi:hypothetical protein
MLAVLGGCGFFSPDNPPQPIWGIWMGPFPTSVSTDADSARWVFTSGGIYLLYALKLDGSLVSREFGYYSTSGIILTLSQEPGGGGNTEELQYEAQDDILSITIRGGVFAYRRVGTAEQADDLKNALHMGTKRGAQ